ncbi:hypothetical protein [Glaciihabitans sp. UYNi722]|uniref:hypothetical protein n=1 Tax=Glaciihabitans sp. UYNi722 TaxID=3156344 RepID=UPI00339B1D22
MIFVVTFGVMWGPFYFMRSEGQLFLYPIALLLILVIVGFAIVGLIFAAMAISKAPPKSRAIRTATAWAVLSGVLVILPLPAIWFGNAPALLFAG